MYRLTQKKSLIHGKGVFTLDTIPSQTSFHSIPLDSTSHSVKKHFAHIGDSTWVDDRAVLNFVNHSCDPNASLQTKPSPHLLSCREISAGEEITVDYNLTELGGVKVPCSCQTNVCRSYFLRIE